MEGSETEVGYQASADAVPESLEGELVVIDDFYADPEAVRKLALGAEYVDFGEAGNFPGRESVKAFFTADHVRRFEALLDRGVHHDPTRWVFGKFRLAQSGDCARTAVHIDKVDWTAVVYLSLPPDCVGGLGVYGHRPTGRSRVPNARELERLDYQDLDDYDRRVIAADSTDAEKWELVHTVPIRYNRCVLFRGARLFHGITQTFGSDPQTGRLTQNFFFMEAEGETKDMRSR